MKRYVLWRPLYSKVPLNLPSPAVVEELQSFGTVVGFCMNPLLRFRSKVTSQRISRECLHLNLLESKISLKAMQSSKNHLSLPPHHSIDKAILCNSFITPTSTVMALETTMVCITENFHRRSSLRYMQKDLTGIKKENISKALGKFSFKIISSTLTIWGRFWLGYLLVMKIDRIRTYISFSATWCLGHLISWICINDIITNMSAR